VQRPGRRLGRLGHLESGKPACSILELEHADDVVEAIGLVRQEDTGVVGGIGA
jgi:hypothetical protein